MVRDGNEAERRRDRGREEDQERNVGSRHGNALNVCEIGHFFGRPNVDEASGVGQATALGPVEGAERSRFHAVCMGPFRPPILRPLHPPGKRIPRHPGPVFSKPDSHMTS